MADDLADFPIVVLENDSPERVGRVGLFDLLMPVANTGLVFTAAVPGLLSLYGPVFTELVRRAANLRAATTLVHMGLVRGESVEFIREALGLTPQQLAAISGVDLLDVSNWEANTVVVPIHVWGDLAARACLADGRTMPLHHALCPDWRPRLIRVFPNIPSRGVSQVPQGPAYLVHPLSNAPASIIPGAECYPPPRC